MKRPRWALPAALTWAAALAPCAGQLEIRGNVILGAGGGGIVFSTGSGMPIEEPDPAGAHRIEFGNGHQLHGTLESLDFVAGRVFWKRPDAALALALPLAQVRRLVLDAPPKPIAGPMATIKLAGGDWLNAEVTGIEGEKIQLELPDGARLTTSRAYVEWIYFSKAGAVESYDGPTSLSGWTSTGGGWSYRDGALRALNPGPVQRQFQALPDLVEYRLTVDQGNLSSAFTITLHSGTANRASTRRVLQLMVRENTLNLWGPVAGDYKSQQIELPATPGAPREFGRGPVQVRIFEDVVGGRVFLFLNGKKQAEWKIDAGEAGKNGGGFQFQSNSWSGQQEQTISKIQVRPWDGRLPGEEEETDRDSVLLSDGALIGGKILSADAQNVVIERASGPQTIERENITLLRWPRPASPPDEAPPVASVRLAQGGSFEVAKLQWKEGKLAMQTNFGGELRLTTEEVAEVAFRREAQKETTPADLLVFRNGDRLRGSLRGAADDGQLSWAIDPMEAPVDFKPGLLAGIQFAPQVPALPGNVTARFRNGDTWTANFVTLDRDHLVLDTAEAGQRTLPRAALKALYFNPSQELTVSEATSDHQIWERGMDMNSSVPLRKVTAETVSPWRYFAGTYTWANQASTRLGGVNLGRVFEALPDRAEVAFTVTSTRPMIYFSAQLFTEPSNPGYMVHLSSAGLSLYDMNPKNRARGMVQQQMQFGKEIDPAASQRRLRFLADRKSGRLVIIVDGVIVGQVNPKAADGPRNLGRGVMIVPQMNLPLTFSDIWVGPWDGQLPKKSGVPASHVDTVVLTNGDEAQGAVELATPTSVKMTSELGPLDLALERMTMIDFGGTPGDRAASTRLQLTGQGSLSAEKWRLEDDAIILKNAVAGELRLPLDRVQEIVFASPDSPITPKPTPP